MASPGSVMARDCPILAVIRKTAFFPLVFFVCLFGFFYRGITCRATCPRQWLFLMLFVLFLSDFLCMYISYSRNQVATIHLHQTVVGGALDGVQAFLPFPFKSPQQLVALLVSCKDSGIGELTHQNWYQLCTSVTFSFVLILCLGF